MFIGEAIERFIIAKQAEGRSPATISMYWRCLSLFARFTGSMSITDITADTFRAYLNMLQSPERQAHDHNPHRPSSGRVLSRETVRTYFRHVRVFLRWCFEEEYCSHDPTRRVKMPAAFDHGPKDLHDGDLVRLLDAAASTGKMRERDTAILLVLADTGIRAGGLLSLTLDRVTLDAGGGGMLEVIEKGQRARFVPCTGLTADALRLWLDVRSAQPGVNNVFTTCEGTPLAYWGLRMMLKRLAERANKRGNFATPINNMGVTQPVGLIERCNPHAFRHFVGRRWIENGGDLASLARLLGHSSSSITARFYTRFDTTAMRREHAEHSPLRGLINEKGGTAAAR